ncbi:MAG: DUF3667 domain-containing protein [Bacteroidales bacterium]|nr:DUF3667 domain-containing protein [Bacteroidales bacterium]
MRRRKAKGAAAEAINAQEPRACLNCGHMDTGKFCSSCGQSFADIDKPMKDVLHDLLEIFNLDRSIVKTIIPFLFKPGFLSSEYMAGRRKKYLSPVKFYLFMSIVFFFIAREASNVPNSESETIRFTLGSDSNQTVITDDSSLVEILGSDSLYYGMASPVDSLDEEAYERSEKIRNNALKALNNKEMLINEFYKFISYNLFILMPIFALLLKLLYIRRKRYYIEHLVFSINMHSFALFLLSVLLSLKLIIKGNDDYVSLLFLIVPVYFTIGMKRFYKQSIFKTLVKEFILALIYSILLIASLLGAAILAFTVI